MARRSATAIVLSHLEFDLLWEDLGTGEPPYPLEVRSHGETTAERDDLGAEVYRALAEAGLTDGEDVSPHLEGLFGLLASNTLSADAILFRPQPWRVLAAMRAGRGVLAILNGQEVALEPITDIVEAMSWVIGESPAGPGEQIGMPRSVFSEAMDAYARSGYPAMEQALTKAGITGRSLRSITTLLESGRTAAGQLAVTGPAGRSQVLSWTDTTAGRYALAADHTSDTPWLTLTPADHSWLTRHLATLLRTATTPPL